VGQLGKRKSSGRATHLPPQSACCEAGFSKRICIQIQGSYFLHYFHIICDFKIHSLFSFVLKPVTPLEQQISELLRGNKHVQEDNQASSITN